MYVMPLGKDAVGRRLGRTVQDAGGQVLLRAGVTLTPPLVEALWHRGYRSVYVVNDLAPDVVADDVLHEETRRRAVEVIQTVMQRTATGRPFPVAQVQTVVDLLLRDLRSNSDLACSVQTLRSVDDYTFVHSVNVCVYCLIMGASLGYDRNDMRRLGVGALLHDIGKVNYADIVSVRRPLTPEEYERVKGHARDGYEMLRHHQDVDLLSAHVAFQHHERLDGSGYPRGLRDQAIIDYGRIAAVADVYDALSSDRPYREGLSPLEAMETLRSLAGEKLDGYLVHRFAERIAVYPTGTIVVLEGGCIAVVVGQSAQGPDRPVVRILTDTDQRLIQPYESEVGGDRRIRAVLASYPRRVREQLAAGKAGA